MKSLYRAETLSGSNIKGWVIYGKNIPPFNPGYTEFALQLLESSYFATILAIFPLKKNSFNLKYKNTFNFKWNSKQEYLHFSLRSFKNFHTRE